MDVKKDLMMPQSVVFVINFSRDSVWGIIWTEKFMEKLEIIVI